MLLHQRPIISSARSTGLVLALGIISLSFCEEVASQPEAKDIVAIQLRAQGVPCTNPAKAVKDIQDSSRDEMAWILTCKEATYRVKLIPHVGSKIEIIDADQLETGSREMKE